MRTTTKNNTNELPRLEANTEVFNAKMGKKCLKTHVNLSTKKGKKCTSNPKIRGNTTLELMKNQPILWLGLRNKIMVKSAQATGISIRHIDMLLAVNLCSMFRKTSGFSLKELELMYHMYTVDYRYNKAVIHELTNNGYMAKISDNDYYRITTLGLSVVAEVLGASVKVLNMIERRLYNDHKNRITAFYTELSPECFGKTGKVVEIDGVPTLEFDDSRYCEKSERFK